MLNIRFNKSRKKEEGQYYIELVTFDPTSDNIQFKFGYWCDIQHIEAGVIPEIVRYFPMETSTALVRFNNRLANKDE